MPLASAPRECRTQTWRVERSQRARALNGNRVARGDTTGPRDGQHLGAHGDRVSEMLEGAAGAGRTRDGQRHYETGK